jgi:hypothetical protein
VGHLQNRVDLLGCRFNPKKQYRSMSFVVLAGLVVFSSRKSQLLVAACLVGTLALPMMVSAQESDEDEGEG